MTPFTELSWFSPPYFEFVPADRVTHGIQPPRGVFLVWDLKYLTNLASTTHRIAGRPHGMELVVILPRAHDIPRIQHILDGLGDYHPCGILPASLNSAERLRQALRNLPRRPKQDFTDYVRRRGLLCSDRACADVSKLFAEAPVVRSVSDLARRMATSRRTLGRHFAEAGIPTPSHWLQIARLLYVSLYLQRNRCSIGRAAAEVGYPDPFTMSNQMKRLTGLRPTDVKCRYGWTWIIECWVLEETKRGSFDGERYRQALVPYLSEQFQISPHSSRTAPIWRQTTEQRGL